MARKKQSAGSVAAAAARAATEAALQSSARDDGLDVIVGDDEEAGELDALESLAELGEGTEYTYVVMCLSPIDKRGRIETVTRDALAELPDYLRDRYGPGKYSVQAKGPRGYVKGSHRIITISTLAARTPAAASGSAASAAAAGGVDWQEWRREQAQLDERRRQEQREDQKFMLQLMVTAMGNRESLGSLVTAMSGLKTLSGPEAAAVGPDKMIELLTRGMELGGGKNPPETVLGVIRETIKDLAGSPLGQSVMDRIANRQPVAGAATLPRIPYQPATPAPATAAPSPAGSGAAPPAPTGDPMLAQALPLLNKLADELLEYATNGTDPGLAAEALVAKVPRMVRAMLTPEQLKTWLTLPDWWARVVSFRPALQPYMGFCDDVRQALYSLLVEPAPEDGEHAEVLQ